MKTPFFITLITFAISVFTVSAQKISIHDFIYAERDLTAITEETQRLDQNGNVCALLKMATTHNGFTFDVGMLGVVDVARVGGEIWVYVPFSVKRISISHQSLGIIDYVFPLSIESGRVYSCKLETPDNLNILEPQYVIVNPDIYPLGKTKVLHDFYFFEKSDCKKLIGNIARDEEIEVLQTEFHYYRAIKGEITKVLNDYDKVGFKVGDTFDIFLWWGDDTWLVSYKGELTYMPFRPDFTENTIGHGIYDFCDLFEGKIIDDYEDKTALFKVKTKEGKIGWIKYDSRGVYDGIYRHFEF